MQWLRLPAATFGLGNNYHAKEGERGGRRGGGRRLCSGLKWGDTMQLPCALRCLSLSLALWSASAVPSRGAQSDEKLQVAAA